MKIKGNAYFLMLILAVILLIIIFSLTMEDLKSKLLPVLMGGGTFILATMELVRELRSGKTLTEDKRTTIGAAERRGYLIAGMWIVGFFLAIYLLGFNIATALFVLTYMKMHNTGWFQSITYAVLTTAGIYGIFQYLMKVDLCPGIVFTMFR